MSSNRELSPGEAAFDVGIVIVTIIGAWAVSRHLIYPALSIPDNAPVILRPILGFFAAWWLLHRRGLGWASVGLRKPRAWWILVAGAVGLYLANIALSTWVAPVLAEWIGATPRPSFMAYIHGNLPAFLLWATIGIVVGGVMEECLFRGFLLMRVAALLGGGSPALAVGIVAQALLFGALHLYGGAFAFTFAALAALASGVTYLLVGRNLWPLMLVHAAWNTVSIWGIYT